MCYDCILCHTLETSCITTDKHNSREILLYCLQFRRINSKNRVLLVLKKKYKKFWNDWYNYRKNRKQSMQFNEWHICEIYRQIKLNILIYIYWWDHINTNIYLYFFKKKNFDHLNVYLYTNRIHRLEVLLSIYGSSTNLCDLIR